MSYITESEYKGFVTMHVLHHLEVGDFYTPSDDNCELYYCTCKVAVLYRKFLEVHKLQPYKTSSQL